MDLMLDGIIAFFGLYLIYCAVNMKKTGELAKGIMVKKDADLSKAKDIQGYIEYMYVRTIVMGICTCICGLIGIYNDTHGGLGKVYFGVVIVFFVAIVIFGCVTAKAQKKYLGI